MPKRLYRSTTDTIIAGVCGGLGKYLGIDPTFIRIFFVLGVWSGLSLLIYPMLWIILPREDQPEATTEETIQAGAAEIAEQAESFRGRIRTRSRHPEVAGMVFGGLLILAGISALSNTMHLYLNFVNFDLVGPLVLIAIGFVLIQRRTKTA